MLLNEDQQMIRDAVRSFVQAQITPHAARRTLGQGTPLPQRRAPGAGRAGLLRHLRA